MSTSTQIPHIHLLCIDDELSAAFEEARAAHNLGTLVSVTIHDCALSMLPSSAQFDLVVSPANSYGRLDGGFDDAISRAFSPRDDYLALTRVAQEALYDEWRGFAPPGTCTIVRIPEDFRERSRNIWGTKHLALCPTMRVPMNVRWNREVVYETTWSLLCAIDKHNRVSSDKPDDKISSILMTPMATGTGYVSADRWANQTVLALKHFVEALTDSGKWSALGWPEIYDSVKEVATTWELD
ncbi:hypothetical protein AK830_g9644 [Neonectria ditissima]|uniref:ADP-ribose 1''-phosphate phosphatase n=1 Tax=Neonectria ditissima TaxID=78410 RepID=A0A0P7B8S0_9HYPO|nr:hypothetical protein AK830_g9644 [Neonectria ditissima]